MLTSKDKFTAPRSVVDLIGLAVAQFNKLQANIGPADLPLVAFSFDAYRVNVHRDNGSTWLEVHNLQGEFIGRGLV